MLNSGTYGLSVALAVPRIESIDERSDILFEVVEVSGGSFASYPFKERRHGLLVTSLPWQVIGARAETSPENDHPNERSELGSSLQHDVIWSADPESVIEER